MSASQAIEVSEFCLEGRFINFVIKDGYKLKGLLLATPEGESYIKLAKHLRTAFDLRLPPGTWLQVVGYKKHDLKNGTVTLKAERVMAARSDIGRGETIAPVQEPPSVDNVKVKPAKTKTTILVCQKSDCMKRGGKAVCQALEAALSDRGLEDQVTIKGTGCMKNCKAGPNLVMPDKTRHSRIQAAQVPALMNQHFGDKSLSVQPENLREAAISNGKFYGN
ncbi:MULTISPECIES: (2Fe-2S) ferredoxin domain-containing protein [unclassified Nostoc]|uniref:(2Fe-2S) ferredoxin domain-containing protein n=1 Tax=unclassified Nostoc TaxID=2593658 RepID=UPI002AD5811A|nr:(2Fe-2S) ferredoxin domain-containing protein [Nostoc sp. DedQUE03]MDZ7971268.1 (2Fe-2S) ferredoxin domain-containing protein [Nostoc sp. DedQUE03]MDZ8043555.1 (2Fe-2S) ferredoxin domain-containing protein [Nostoc sp. DedQUE02]